MICCLNPHCQHPLNPDGTRFCQSCGTELVILRNRYQPIKVLGSGGFGKTYLAQDLDKLKEKCVIKQLVPQVQGSWAINKAKELFAQEAKQLQQLGYHTQVPLLLAYFEQDDFLYLVQEYIEGQSLSEELAQQGTFSESQILELLRDLLPVLQFIHNKGVIHRDLKPENIMRRQENGQLVLIDFGVAKQLTNSLLSKPGTSIGSFGYAPLEQMRGGKAYPASDLFSLGATCFHLLSNTHPWQLWTRQGYSWVDNWQEYVDSAISQPFAKIIDQLLHEDYQQRYQSSQAVIADLTLPQVSPTSPTVPTPRVQTEPTQPLNIAKIRNKTTKLLISLIGGATVLISLGGYGIWQLLDTKSPPKSPYEQLTLGKTFTQHQGTITSFAITPDGNTLVSGSNDHKIALWDLSTGKLESIIDDHSAEILSLAISPDGKTLVSGSGHNDYTIKVRNLLTGEIKYTLMAERSIFALAISPDGEILASGGSDNKITIWNLSTGELIRTIKAHQNWIRSLVISPDQQILVSGSKDSQIKVWDLSTGTLKQTLDSHSGTVRGLAISSDGKTLVSASGDRTLKTWDLTTLELSNTFTGHTHYVLAVTISPDGGSIVSGSEDGTLKVWDATTGALQNNLPGHSTGVFAVAISPDGKTVVSGSSDSTIKVWQIESTNSDYQ